MASGLIDPGTGQPFTNGQNGNGRPPITNFRGIPYQGGYSDTEPGDGYGTFPIPHAITYSAILQGSDRTYWHNRWDEAYRTCRENALVMRRDAFLMGLTQERKLGSASIPWHLEIPDERDQEQVVVRDAMTRAVENISDLRRIMYALLEAIWYGRYGVGIEWTWTRVRTSQGTKRMMTVADWYPVNGDKLGWNWDGEPYVLVNAGVATDRPDVKIVNTTAGGRGLLLRGTWRDHFLIHRHEMDDGDFFEPEMAAAVWGVGVRSRIFWMDWIRREYLEWITTFLERVGLGVTLWYYDGGNPQALSAVQAAARNQSRRANLFVPIFTDGKGSPKGLVERIETPVNGVDALRMLKDDIEQKIERFIIGQEASSKSEGSVGLGNAQGAKFQFDTKRQIIQFDAFNLSETLTGNARNPGLLYLMQKYSFPGTLERFRVKWSFGLEKQDPDKKLSAMEKVISWGLAVKADEARSAAGLSKPGPGDEVIQGQQQGQPGMEGQPGQPGAEPGAEGAPGEQPPGEEQQPGGGPLNDFEPPMQSPDQVLGDGAEQALQMQRQGDPVQYVGNEQIARDMIARRHLGGGTKLPNVAAPPGWNIYHGPHGGIGWKHGATGKVIYATTGRTPFSTRGQGQPATQPQGQGNIQAKIQKRHLHAKALAKWYADHWNLLTELHFEINPKEKEEAGHELWGTGVALWMDEHGDKKWQVVKLGPDNKPEGVGQNGASQPPQGQAGSPPGVPTQGSVAPQQYAFNPSQARVPAGQGPMTIAGQEYRGGQWVPEQIAEQASPEQKKILEAGHRASAEEKMGRGPVSPKGMKIRVGVMGGNQELGGHQLRETRGAFNGLMAHHGELLLHRIDDQMKDTEAVLATMAPDDPARAKFEQRGAAYGHMMDWAKEQGVHPTGEPEEADYEKEPPPVRGPGQEVKPEQAQPQQPQPFAQSQEPHDVKLKQKIEIGLRNVPEDLWQGYRKTAHEVLGRMGDKARQMLNNNVGRFSFYADVAAITNAYVGGTAPVGRSPVGGFFSWGNRSGGIHIDGMDPVFRMGRAAQHMGMPEKIYAHEIGHGIDGPGLKTSKNPEWIDAYTSEIKDGQLSDYAAPSLDRQDAENYAEGFAEFSRLLHFGGANLAKVRDAFPKSWAFWQRNGLLPTEAEQMTMTPAEGGAGPQAAPAGGAGQPPAGGESGGAASAPAPQKSMAEQMHESYEAGKGQQKEGKMAAEASGQPRKTWDEVAGDEYAEKELAKNYTTEEYDPRHRKAVLAIADRLSEKDYAHLPADELVKAAEQAGLEPDQANALIAKLKSDKVLGWSEDHEDEGHLEIDPEYRYNPNDVTDAEEEIQNTINDHGEIDEATVREALVQIPKYYRDMVVDDMVDKGLLNRDPETLEITAGSGEGGQSGKVASAPMPQKSMAEQMHESYIKSRGGKAEGSGKVAASAEPQPSAQASGSGLSRQQKYSIASGLATGKPEPLLAKMRSSGLFSESEIREAEAFAREIDKHYKKRDGFVPDKVRKLIG